MRRRRAWSVEPKTGLVLSPQAVGLACSNYAAGGPPRQQLAGPTIALAADRLFATKRDILPNARC